MFLIEIRKIQPPPISVHLSLGLSILVGLVRIRTILVGLDVDEGFFFFFSMFFIYNKLFYLKKKIVLIIKIVIFYSKSKIKYDIDI